jgi:hypothetical protein
MPDIPMMTVGDAIMRVYSLDLNLIVALEAAAWLRRLMLDVAAKEM